MLTDQRLTCFIVLAAFLLLEFNLAFAQAQADSSINAANDFETKIAPILTAKCVSCHRSDNQKGGLDLSTRATAIKGGDGGASLVADKPDDSPIYLRSVSHNGQPPEMPAKGEPLTAAEAASLRDWIQQGAVWPETILLREKAKADGTFWSFQPIAQISPPLVENGLKDWGKNPIDQFVLAKLREAGLEPNNLAPARVFVRRAYYDLTGLPPSPEEVDQFLQSVDQLGMTPAVERLIDRLLESPRYGEAWGRHWLDVIRFGESRGYERNEIITNLWPFRDYVIRSFNDDKPFDRFIREHLTGDLIGKDLPEVEIGSAFLVAGPYDDVGNQDAAAAAQIRADQMDEMIRATSEAFLGLTIGCSRCHDHKFDPITAKDYYSLYATFSGTVHGVREVATSAEREARSAKLGPLQDERKKLITERDLLEKSIVERIKQIEPEQSKRWTRPRHSRYLTEERFTATKAEWVRLVVDGTDANDPNRKTFKIDEFEVWTAGDGSRNVALTATGAIATGSAPKAKDFGDAYGADLTIDGKFGESWLANGPELIVHLSRPEQIERVVFSSDRTRSLADDHSLTVFVGDYRIEVSNDGKDWRTVASSDDRQPPTAGRRQARLRKLVLTNEDSKRLDELNQRIGQLDQQIAGVPPLPVWWVGTHRESPGPFAVFLGGSPQRRGAEVIPASLSVLGWQASKYQLEAGSTEAERRMALAKWLTADDNPLVPRVLANRIWHYHFGTGIVNTPSDFGYMGSRPTHPELLDWLARQIVENGWKLKPIHKLIMTSQTYRQSSDWNADRAAKDADSRWLWRFLPRRLSAEEIRDSLLSVSGRLNLQMGGPGFRLYEYQQDNVATYVPLNVHGPETFRRSVYHHNARASRVDVLTDFDCPDPAFSEPRRAATTTPLQALTMMNHRFSLSMANSLADRLKREAPDPVLQVKRSFALIAAREPSETELKAGVELIETHGLRAFCRAMLNSNELVYLD